MKRHPITLAEQARDYRRKAARSLARLPALEAAANEVYTVANREAVAAESRFYQQMIREAKTCEALIRAAAEYRAQRVQS